MFKFAHIVTSLVQKVATVFLRIAEIGAVASLCIICWVVFPVYCWVLPNKMTGSKVSGTIGIEINVIFEIFSRTVIV